MMKHLVPPEASTSLVDYVTEKLQEMILTGQLKPDDAINISAISKQAGVSIVPIREALARLSATGLLRFVPNKGYRVSPPLEPEMRALLFQAREILELSAAPLVIANSTKEDIAKLREINASMSALHGKDPDDIHTFFRLNDVFHHTYLAMSGNPYLARMFENLSFDLLMGREVSEPIDIPKLTQEHVAIIDAIEQRNKRHLEKVMAVHIRGPL
jgi:DNA-binding GntR family transcriptional regulator